jgi:adenylate cyclase
MPTLVFDGNELGPPIAAEAEGGGRLLDVCDDVRAPVGLSCRDARCGTCRIEVVAGADLLAPPAQDEIEVLEAAGAPPSHRLACQAIVRPGPGVIRLRWVSRGT